ncbi:MAG: hypothetical protein WBN75_00305 [Verrucomicrobiia bacterium]
MAIPDGERAELHGTGQAVAHGLAARAGVGVIGKLATARIKLNNMNTANGQFSALYYPSIEFADPRWLWASSLVWDRIYRIVPKDYTAQDSDNVKRLCESGEIGAAIHPDQYAKDVSDQFLIKLRSSHWNAAALDMDVDVEYTRLHEDKVDVQLRKLIIAQGSGKWLHVPTEFAAHYMTYLAKYVSEKNGLNLVTDAAPAWTGATYFKYDGMVEDWPREEFPLVLAALVVRDFVPTNILNITPAALLSFREKYRDERRRFVGAVQSSAKALANCHDAKLVRDVFEDMKRDIAASMEDYKRSMDILKVETWTGMKTIIFPATTGVISKYIPLDPTQLAILNATGLAMGVVSGLATMKQKGKRLSEEYDYSYLVNLQREWQTCYRGEDWNYFLCRQMEEFIND